MGRGWKTEMWHAGVVGHGKGDDQGGVDVHRARGGQGQHRGLQVPLLGHGKGLED